LARRAIVIIPAATVATTVALSLTLSTIIMGMRLRRGRRSWGVIEVERLWGSHGHVGAELDLLQDQLVSDLVEGQEQGDVHDDGLKMIVLLV
jgi:hypothetical protein